MGVRTDECVLTLTRMIRATPEQLFDAWTKPDLLVKWWGPEGMTTPVHDLDVREGGAWSTTMQNAAGEQYVCSGVYRVIERPSRLVFTWGWRQPDGARGHETTVEVTFAPRDGGTEMTLVQQTFENVEQRDSHGAGWTSSFNDLEKQFA